MLDKLLNILKDNDLFFESPIKDLPDSSCLQSDFKVIDFDRLKETYFREVGRIGRGNTPKSCDALKIDCVNNCIWFIEMKDLSKWILKLESLPDRQAKDNKVEEKFRDFGIDQKIIDSFALLLDIARHYKIDPAFFPFIISQECEKNFIFLIHVKANDFVRHIMSKGYKYKYRYWLFRYVDFMPADNFHDFMEKNKIK